jgi:hypothetical protein
MLQPARTKYRKMMKGRMRGKAYAARLQGEYGRGHEWMAHGAADRGRPRGDLRQRRQAGSGFWTSRYQARQTHGHRQKREYYVAVVKRRLIGNVDESAEGVSPRLRLPVSTRS